ncbi:pimeloyl-ACP methyl ester carboxylesterase [Planomicrobium stackebrandtii]|uniref:Pimeloyl-ACP methyl ester carboxylesterase n=1 Tax=Planomicrobium stackebrandtii TaxID=253160 RepID=A0ABU0GR70_9BACL|nr:alpha/beta hydrolase [Planomicrobium stackebrandtii]MDQ0427538.1 pimeloyl-ACP methyl ester carboxylesterase [Planomicrobium stackebrandtii]
MLQYIDYNQESTGPAIIAIPALGERKEMYEQLAKNLAKFRFIAVDLPGHNNCSSEDFSIENYTKDLMELLDQLSIRKAHFIGNSIGAWIIQSYSKSFPQSIHSLTLLDGGYYFSGDYEESEEETELPIVEKLEDLQEAISQQVESKERLSPFNKEWIKSYFLKNFFQADGVYIHHSKAKALNVLSKSILKNNYCLQQNTKLPVLLLLADQEPVSFKEDKIRSFLFSNTNATIKRIPDSYHLLPLTNSNLIATHIEKWLVSVTQ